MFDVKGKSMLEIKNICYDAKEPEGTKKILKNVSFSVKKDEMVVITGPNGSGKSTLAKIIMGILKPTSGQVLFDGKDITGLSITERANLGFGYAFQTPVVFKGLTVKDLIDLATKKTNTIAMACEYLSRVGLCAREYVNREVNSRLSGGELKRIELAVLLAKNSEVNICDEPEAGIDLWSFDAFVRLFSEKRKTYLVISHQKRLIEIADKVIVLRKGEVEHEGSFDEMKEYLFATTCNRLEEK
jgi:Fe-S cluster assembly ATP-binding protein